MLMPTRYRAHQRRRSRRSPPPLTRTVPPAYRDLDLQPVLRAPSRIDSSSGAVTVADTSAIDYETATSCTITVQQQVPTPRRPHVRRTDHRCQRGARPAPIDSDSDANTVSEGAVAKVRASLRFPRMRTSDTISCSITDQSCARAFGIDSSSGQLPWQTPRDRLHRQPATPCSIDRPWRRFIHSEHHFHRDDHGRR